MSDLTSIPLTPQRQGPSRQGGSAHGSTSATAAPAAVTSEAADDGVPPTAIVEARAPETASPDGAAARPRVRMSKAERRRQLVGVGLEMLTTTPIQEVSLDAVAERAGISRGLLFHYFPTKTAYYESVVRAAGRRVVRTVRPDAGARGQDAVRQVVERFVAQIDRRRDVYLALVQGNLSDLGGSEVAGSLRARLSIVVLEALEHDDDAPGRATFPLVHAWLAYVEDVAIAWSDPQADERATLAGVVDHCERALGALLALPTVALVTPAPATTVHEPPER